MNELLELLRTEGWAQDEHGDYVHGPYYVAILREDVITVGVRPLDPKAPADTNKWGQKRSLEDTIEWVREKSEEDRGEK